MADNLSNDAFNDALNRARQLAAKIGSGEKRPLEDGDGGMNNEGSFAGNAPKRMNSDMNGSAISSIGGGGPPNSNMDLVVVEQYKVPDSMVGLIIGRGGEQINSIQAQTQCRVQMAQDSGGLPDRVCTLTGTKEAVKRAIEMIGQIIAKGSSLGGSNAPPSQQAPGSMIEEMLIPGSKPGEPGSVIEEMLVPGRKVGLVIGKGGENLKQIQAQLGVRMIVIQDTNTTSMSEKPLRIIGPAEKVAVAKQMVTDQMNSKDDGPGFGGFGPKSLGEVIVPRMAVGVIIGKNGEMIKRLQNESGARVQFKINEDPNAPERTAILTGAADQIEKATQMITDLVRQAVNKQGGPMPPMGGGGGGFGGGGGGGGGGRQEVFYMHVPSTKTGLVIGKGGETIRQINTDSGAHVELSREAPPNDFEKIFIIRGSPQAIHHAQHLIRIKVGDILPNTPLPPFQGNANTFQPQPAAPAVPAQSYPYPSAVAPAPAPQPQPDQQAAWNAYYAYYQQALQQTAQQPGAPGAPAAAQPQPQPQAQPVSTAAASQPAGGAQTTPAPTVNPITGQPDYSAAWAEYYRSLGMHEQAAIIEQQAKANQQAAAQHQAAAQPQPQPSYPAYPTQQQYSYPQTAQYPQQF